MNENEDQKWARLQRERDQNRPRNGGAIVREDADATRLLTPANEGHDLERARIRETKWAGQTVAGSGGGPPEFSAPRAAEHGEVPVESGPETKVHGSPFHANDRERRSAGGEARKHPRPAAETSPEPGVGRFRPSAHLPTEPEIPPGATPIGAEVDTVDDRDRLQPGSRRRPPHM